MDLASEDRHLVAQRDDLHREVRISATDEADQLKHPTQRPVEEREGHGSGCLPPPALAVKVQLTAGGRRSRQVHRLSQIEWLKTEVVALRERLSRVPTTMTEPEALLATAPSRLAAQHDEITRLRHHLERAGAGWLRVIRPH